MNSSLDYDSSDKDSFSRKLKAICGKERDPDLGKVVAVDFGDRRKRDNWYPGLVVPHPAQSNIKISKEEYLIRSFKDGKYYQVPKRNTREFTRDHVPPKIENNALKIAVEKALLYLEKEELPTHWDKALFMGLELASADEDSQDSDYDTSDDEPSEDKDRLVAQLYKFMDERGTPINKAPSVSNKDLNLHKLFKIMHKMGGFNKVTNQNKWKIVYTKMGLPQSNLNGANQLKSAYKRYLQSFEDFYRKLGCTMVDNSRSTRGRHRSDRNFILTRTRDREATASPKGRSSKDIKDGREKADKSDDKKADKRPRLDDKKISRTEEERKFNKSEERTKSLERKRPEKPNSDEKEDRPRLVRSQSLTKEKKINSPKEDDKKDGKTEKARTREDARKEKNESPEKKTRSSLKIEMEKKEEAVKEKKEISPNKKDKKEDRPLKDIKDEKLKEKRDEKVVKERKIIKDKKIIERPVAKSENSKEKNEDKDKLREKRESLKDSKNEKNLKGRKEEGKPEEKSPLKKKLDRLAKEKKEEKIIRPRRENKSPLPDNKKTDETDNRNIKDEKARSEVESKKEESSKEKPGPKLGERHEDTPHSEGDDIETSVFDDKDASQDEMDKKGPGPKSKDDSEEPPNKGKRRPLKLPDDKDLDDILSDSDDEEQDKSMKDLKNYEIVLGDRVKVKYGRGRLKKVYDAKVLKIQADGPEKRYFVHYNGWNNRYDEWVKRSFIVALVTPDNKQSKETAPQSTKRIDRGRPPGPINQSKPARKNSTSSTNSSLSSSRATRSDKKILQPSPLSSGLEPKKRIRRKSGVTGLMDTSQDSDSDNDENDLDDDDVGDADVEDNANTQNDSCFKEELFSDDEEKEKLEDVKRDDISELEKSIPLEENSECIKDSLFNPIGKAGEKTEAKAETSVLKEVAKKLQEFPGSELPKGYEKSVFKLEGGNELTLISQNPLSVKLTVKDSKTIVTERHVIQQLDAKSQSLQSEIPKIPSADKLFKTQQPEKVFKIQLSEKMFKTQVSEKGSKTQPSEKVFKTHLSEKVFKPESQEKPINTSLSVTTSSSTLPDKIGIQLPENNSKTQMIDKESKVLGLDKILKIQLPEGASKIHKLLSEKFTVSKVSEKMPAFQPSDKNSVMKKYSFPENLIMSNINKNVKSDAIPVTTSAEIKPENTLFLSVPSRTAPLLIAEQNKKDVPKSSLTCPSHSNPENRNLSFAGLHGLINKNSLEKSTPMNKTVPKDVLSLKGNDDKEQPMQMSDVFDILNIDRPQTPEITKESILGDSRKKKKKLSDATFKRPEGMPRELFSLLSSDSKDNPPVFMKDLEQGYKQNKAKLGVKNRPWKWTPFTNPARKDEAVFHHRRPDEDEEYPFAKFNKVTAVPKYTDLEYTQHLEKEGWNKQETDHLFDLCQRFDLRFVVIHDRWDRALFPNRSVEDLKERYYNICNVLAKVRAVGNSEPKLIAYNADHERKRKRKLLKLYDMTPEQVEEEQILLNELRKIELNKKGREKKTQDLQNLITAADKSERKCLDKKGPKKKVVQQKNIKTDNMNVDSAGIKFAEFKGSGVSFRSQRMKLPASVDQKKAKAIEQSLKELDIGPNPIPTEDVCTHFNELRSDMVLLYELKLAVANCEFELQTESLTAVKPNEAPDQLKNASVFKEK